jgi:putative ABC transport system permease protein
VAVVRRNLVADWRRSTAGVIAIGLALMLVLLLQGLWQGVKTQASLYPDHVGAQLFVTQRGVANFAGETSTIPLRTLTRVRATPGVRWAAAVRGQFVVFDLHAEKVAAYVVGYRPGDHGGPWKLAGGRTVRSNNEVVVDAALAARHRLGVGSVIDIGGRALRVVGLSAGTSATMTGFVFITHAASDELLGGRGTTSYILVGTDSPADVRARLAAGGLTVFTAQQLAANDRGLTIGIFGSPIQLMVAVAFVTGTLIVALTVYATIVERRREYGVVKAIGATRGWLVGVVIRQALVLSVVGFMIGGGFFAIGRAALHAWRPQFSVVLTDGSIVRALGAAVVMALFASALPARQLANAEPAAVYRGG